MQSKQEERELDLRVTFAGVCSGTWRRGSCLSAGLLTSPPARLYMMSRDKICSRWSSNFSFQLFHHHFRSFVLEKGLSDSSSSPEYFTGLRLQCKTDVLIDFGLKRLHLRL